jgi:hypothetical protein
VVVYYTALTGEKLAPVLTLTAEEKAASSRVPVMTDSVKAFLDGRGKLERPVTLHGLMAYEVLNFVDGARSVLDIYRAVAAEAESAGSWYYATVSREDVEKLLASAEKAGIATFKEVPPAKR